MKLGKLLAAGKSIMNGHTEVSYRSSKQIYLPKFGSAKNPFKDEPPAESGLGASASGQPNESRPGPVRLADDAASGVSATFEDDSQISAAPEIGNSESGHDGHEQPQKPSAAVGKASQRQAPRGEPTTPASGGTNASRPASRLAASIPRKEGKDWAKFNPFSILRGVLPSGKAGRSSNMARGPRGTATQTELSLDTVKVVHNDLSDVDVEVVPIKSRASVPDLPAPKKSWEFVGERLFGVEAT